jgi:alpha-1,2-mannosyltransferase
VPHLFTPLTLQAAGLVTIAHNSGGPRADIVVPAGAEGAGLLASSAEEYADHIAAALDGTFNVAHMVTAGRQQAARFSDEVFSQSFLGAMLPALAAAR